MPDADDFAALARSAPWRFGTLRFTVRWRRERVWSAPLRAWLRRPDRLRVETAAGELLQVVREQRRTVGGYGPAGGSARGLPWPRDADAVPPRWRADGLVAARPSPAEVSLDDPMYQDYRWIAMLDPAELADGRNRETGEPAGPPLVVDAVREVEHAGRPAWEAVVRTTDRYEPRCGCCPLLRDRAVDVLEWGPDMFSGDEYPAEHVVRLDAATGVCVWTEAVGGTWAGDGSDLRIESVDEPMPDDLFHPVRAGLLGVSPRATWSPVAAAEPVPSVECEDRAQ